LRIFGRVCCFQLLNESEATVLRLTEQAGVLKGEIRRLERNQERENAISNMEYLKNIVYKVCRSKVELFHALDFRLPCEWVNVSSSTGLNGTHTGLSKGVCVCVFRLSSSCPFSNHS